MEIKFNKKNYLINKEKILNEILKVKGLMSLLMKKRNTGKSWTKYELAKIKYHFKAISKSIPFFIVFLLPGGMLLLSILALYLDRRKKKRRSF